MRSEYVALVAIGLVVLYFLWPAGLIVLLGIGVLGVLVLAIAAAGHDGRRMKP
jgi:uncharacterized protein involved in response to NO